MQNTNLRITKGLSSSNVYREIFLAFLLVCLLCTAPLLQTETNPGKTSSDSSTDRYGSGGASIYAKGPSMNNYPGSPKKLDIKKVRETEESVHFELDFGGHSDRQKTGWFMFRVDDAGGKEVRLDLTNIGRFDNWKTLNPVLAQIPNLSDPEHFVSKKPQDGYQYVEARNGPKIPVTKGLQRWHYITNVRTKDEDNTLVLKQRFTKDRVYVAMRPPYTVDLHLKYMNLLRDKPSVEVHNVGETKEGTPLNIVQIGGLSQREARKKPCTVVYTREHPDEHDTSHVLMGLINFLLSDTKQAKRLRNNMTFLIIPLLAPDESRKNLYEGEVWDGFDKGWSTGPVDFSKLDKRPWKSSYVARQYGLWFRNWVNKKRRLDISLSLHNVESNEGPHFFCGYVGSTRNESRYDEAVGVHKAIMKELRDYSYSIRENTPIGLMRNRLGGFLSSSFSTLNILYEVNSQAKNRHLSILQLRQIGKILATATGEFFSGRKGGSLIKLVNVWRERRSNLINRYRVLKNQVSVHKKNGPFYVEWNINYLLPSKERAEVKRVIEQYPKWVSQKAKRENIILGLDSYPKWLKHLYKHSGASPYGIFHIVKFAEVLDRK